MIHTNKMAKKGSILVVDDNKNILLALRMLLCDIFYQVHTLSSPKTLMSFLRENKVDVVLLDMNFDSGINSGNEGLFWLNEIKNEYGDKIEVVLITAYADIELAINGIKQGAADFVVKPWDNAKLLSAVRSAYGISTLGKQTTRSETPFPEPCPDMFWGQSRTMERLREMTHKVAATDANILIMGENGTGKELLARHIHALSSRHERPLVAVDMGAVSETLFQSELFGHVKGAFTDARNDRQGKFEAAHGGTLFLDEIGNLPLHLQANLLTVLQTRQVTPLGSNHPMQIDIRLISATNRDIEAMVGSSEFRMDLLYRMNTITLRIPPLRERAEDIVELARIFVRQYCARYNRPEKEISPEACLKLTSYSWPGNIRQLQHAVEKAVIICAGESLSPNDFALNHTPYGNQSTDQDATLEQMERQMIRCAIEKYDSNISMVAAALGISRQTLYNKMKRYDL